MRQTRDQARLKRFRLLNPGEIDHQIARNQLVVSPAPIWDAPTLATCVHLYHRYVEPATGAFLPETAFCDLPRWVFLEYLVQHCGVLLIGSNAPDQTRLEPLTIAQNVNEWNTPRLYAFAESTTALFMAVRDNARLAALDCLLSTTLVTRFIDKAGQEQQGCYFGIDYRALPHAPWRRGTVYLFARTDLPTDYQNTPYRPGVNDRPILPLAKIAVDPWDWPLLDQVHGLDVIAQSDRQHETYDGYPWPHDSEIHPTRWKRPLIEYTRACLNENFADNISLTDLGKRIGVSPYVLLRMFRAEIGLSPLHYQTLRRIAQAKQLLKNGDTIAQVAVETGFCDQTHLTRHFRRIVGTTPGHYLRMQESPICPL